MDKAYTPWTNKSAQELFDFFLEEVLSLAKLSKYKNINDDAVPELPKLANRVQFGTESSDMKHYYEEQEKLIKDMKDETMKERKRKEDTGYYGQFVYMKEYLWPDEKVLIKGYQLQMMFKVEDDRETDWRRGTVTKIIKREEKLVKAEIKWNKIDNMVRESKKSAEVLKKNI